MAKKGMIERNTKRKRLELKFRAKRERLSAIINSEVSSLEEVFQAVLKRAELPRNSARNRIRNRCQLTGRPRGYHRRFDISRIKLRDLAANGLLPGVYKSSW